MICPHCGKRFEDKDQRMRRLKGLKGICQRCSKPAAPGKRCCEDCLKYNRDFQANVRRRDK